MTENELSLVWTTINLLLQIWSTCKFQQNFQVFVKIGGYEANATALNKIAAKHAAAEQVLLKIIDGGEHQRFRLPGETREEARKYM